MRIFVVAIALLLVLGGGYSLQAAELPSCDDLAELANTLEEMEIALKEVGTIAEGDEVDVALGDVVDALLVVADVENDSYLNKSVGRLSLAWEDMDGGRLMDALNDVIGDFDAIIGKECVR